MDNSVVISTPPHVKSKRTTRGIMIDVAIALLPSVVAGCVFFGWQALLIILMSVFACVATEFVYFFIINKGFSNKCADAGKVCVRWLKQFDFTSVVTGLILALILPVTDKWYEVLYEVLIGGVFSIALVKMLFGGLGQNFMNPALGARCFLLIAFTSIMTNFDCDAYTGATPLAQLKSGITPDVFSMVIGRTGGTIGETSMIAIVAGACILILLGIIDLKIPGSYIVSFVVFICLFGGHGPDPAYISAHLAGGGLMLGAFFMATDYVTRPITKKGQYLYGIFLGILTGIFRVFGASSEGVSYAIIIGNLLVPLMEKVTLPKAFGKGGEAV